MMSNARRETMVTALVSLPPNHDGYWMSLAHDRGSELGSGIDLAVGACFATHGQEITLAAPAMTDRLFAVQGTALPTRRDALSVIHARTMRVAQ